MANQKQKLELTWIGKDQRPRLEPRILIEDPELSYHASKRVSEADNFDNLLIQGDNLLALKALEQDFAGKVKCIYIDPPFNTGQAFEHYDDGLEHSIWLNLIRDRLTLLHSLLSADGTLFVHIDDNELGYLMVLLDEICGRCNRAFLATFKQASATGHKAINPGCVTTANYVLAYTKDKKAWRPNRVYTARERDKRYNQFITNIEKQASEWRITTLSSALAAKLELPEREARKIAKKEPELVDQFVIDHASQVIQLARPNYSAVSKAARQAIDQSQEDPTQVYHLPREGHKDLYLIGGRRILFYKHKLRVIDGKTVAGEPLTNIWDDILSNNLHKEGGVKFPKGKKPEALIKRILEISTSPGDIVLDSFAGSGTTGAVAHKMGRKWIMVELGDQCKTHVSPRLRSVIDGNDSNGVTSATKWRGGGGFRFLSIAPSLLQRDKWDNWVVSNDYRPEMLAEAVCKLEGFRYEPDPELFWLHGRSTETDFVYVTTQNLSREQLQFISDQVGPDRTLLICCAAFRAKRDEFENLTLKKIPQAVLSRCEWGRDDYSLNVEALPPAEVAEELSADQKGGGDDEAPATTARKRKTKRKQAMQELPLFDGVQGDEDDAR
jgi:adenine-specific DNA-methyltransferase